MRKSAEFLNDYKGLYVDDDNKERLSHGTDEFKMDAHNTKIFPGDPLVLYYHWHDEFEIFYLSEGKTRFLIGNHELILNSGDMLLIPSGVPHGAFRIDEEYIEFFAVDVHMKFFSSQQSDLIQNKYVLPVFMGWKTPEGCINESVEQYQEIRRRFMKIMDFYERKKPGYELLIKSELFGIMYEVITMQQNDTENHYNTLWVKKILYYIQTNYSQKITLHDMAEQVNMSDSYFCRSVKKVFKASPMEFLARYRVFEAARMIESTDLRLGDIAYEVGFNNVNRFIEAFKKNMHCTPLDYRKKLKQKKDKMEKYDSTATAIPSLPPSCKNPPDQL